MIFRTRYSTLGVYKQITSLYAPTEAHARGYIALRGMDETLEGEYLYDTPEMPSKLYDRNQFVKAHHALTWVAMIASRALPASTWALLNDRGALHELAHITEAYVSSGYFGVGWKHGLGNLIAGWELLVPGLHPAWESDEDHTFLEDVFDRARGLDPQGLTALVRELRPQLNRRIRERSSALTADSPLAWPSWDTLRSAGMDSLAKSLRQTAKAATYAALTMDDFRAALDDPVYTGLEPPAKPGTRKAEEQSRAQAQNAKARQIARYMAAAEKRKDGVKAKPVAAVKPPEPTVTGRLTSLLPEVQHIPRMLRPTATPQIRFQSLLVDGEEVAKIEQRVHDSITLKALRDFTLNPDQLDALAYALRPMMDPPKPRTATEQAEVEQRPMRTILYGREAIQSGKSQAWIKAMLNRLAPRNVVFDIETPEPSTLKP